MDPPKRRVKVIIIGAAVSGLTLAHMLERAGIDFVILERGKEVAFAGGASIGLQPNALRILDQLGLYEDICAATVPIKTAYHRRPNGSVIAGSQFAGELERRHGYPIMFLEREELLHILERRLENRSKVLCLQHVVDIQYDRNRAVVTTASGDAFEGDIVVGADGVRSFTRQTMWKNLAITEPKVSQKESTAMTCEYACVFGVSVYESNDPELVPGTSHITYNEKRSGICIVTNGNRKFWFLILKLERKFVFPDIPRFTKQNMEDILTKHANFQVTNGTRLGDLSKTRSKLTMVALEEAAFTRWFDGRLAILGDAAHKVTPNAGHGGNTAIESAVTLANLLYDVTRSRGSASGLSYQEAEAVLEQYQNTRYDRVAKACAMSAMATRLQAMDNLMWKYLGQGILPLFGDEAEVNASSELMLGGEPLKFLTYKGRTGTIPWEGWNPVALTESAARLSFGPRILSVLPAASIGATVALYWIGCPLPISLSAFVDTKPHGDFETFLNFLELLPFTTIGAIEALRMKNRLLQPFILPLLYAAACSSTKVSWIWLAVFLWVYATQPNLSDQAYANTVAIANAKCIAYTLMGSACLVASFCTPLQNVIWSRVTSSVPTPDAIAAICLACPLAVPLLTAPFKSLLSYDCSEFVYGHADRSQVQSALLVSFGLSFISYLAHLTAFGLGALPFWTNHNLMKIAGLLLALIASLSSAPSRHSSVNFKLKSGLLAAALGAACGPGGAASLLWVWREDKVRCQAQ